MKMISIEVSVDSAIRRWLLYIESNMNLTYWTWTPGVGGGVLPYITYTSMCRPKGS